MTIDFVKFFVIFGILVVLFGIVGNLLFSAYIVSYQSFFESLLTVISVSLGNFDFNQFIVEGDQRQTIIGLTYTVLSIIVFNVLLLNLIIAILSNTYVKYEQKSRALYLTKILSLRHTMLYHYYYGSLFVGLAPINVIIAPFLPFISCIY